MYFHKVKGKQHLDLRGNLIISKNINLITSRVSSAAPKHVENAKYVLLGEHTCWRKIKATFAIIWFIWGK